MKKGRKKTMWGKVKKGFKGMGRDFSQSPLARASRGKHTKGFI